MDIIYLLVPLSLALLVLIGWALMWAVRSGQFEDMEGPAHRILMDDDSAHPGGDAGPAEGSSEALPVRERGRSR